MSRKRRRKNKRKYAPHRERELTVETVREALDLAAPGAQELLEKLNQSARNIDWDLRLD